MRIISDKTASLFSACTEIGASSATEDQGWKKAMKDFGEYVGLAFQIRDDMLDYLGRRSIIGKPTGIDMKEKKLTLPLIYALQKGEPSDAKRALRIIRNGAKRKDIEWVMGYVETVGGIDYALQRAIHFGAKARAELQVFPDSESRQALERFVEFATQRSR